MTRRAAMVASCMLVLGCGSKKKAAYQSVADQLNPILVTLILKVAAIKALGPTADSDDPRLAAVCASTEPELERIGDIHVDGQTLDPGIRWVPAILLFDRNSQCRWSIAESKRPAGTCMWACTGGLAFFTQIAAEFEAGARAEGVYVIGLPHVFAR